jgi:hypothetical protein
MLSDGGFAIGVFVCGPYYIDYVGEVYTFDIGPFNIFTTDDNFVKIGAL